MRRISNVLLPRFSLLFSTNGPDRFHFLCKILLPGEIQRQKHFLTAKTTAKTARPSLFVLGLGVLWKVLRTYIESVSDIDAIASWPLLPYFQGGTGHKTAKIVSVTASLCWQWFKSRYILPSKVLDIVHISIPRKNIRPEQHSNTQ